MQIAIRNDVIIENIYIMGKIRLLLLLVLTIPCIARGQITIRQTAIVEKAVLRPERFDSLKNIVPTERDKTYNLKKYLEQEVFFIPVAQPVLQKALEGERLLAAAQKTLDSLCELQQACTDSIRQLTSKGQRINLFKRNDKIAEKSAELQQRSLSLIYPIDQQEQKINRIKYAYPSYSPYRRAQQGGFYRSDSLGNASGSVAYSEIANRYYTVIDLMTGSVNDRGEGRFTRAKERFSQLAFLLKERDADNYLLWYFRDVSDLNKEGNFGYRIDNESYDIYFSLLSSYFVKARQLFVGKNLLARNDKTGFVDINTGEIVQVNKGSKWRCEELTLIELENIPVLVPFYLLTNEAGETIKLPLPPKIRNKDYPTVDFITESRDLYDKRQLQLREEQRRVEEEAREKVRQQEETAFRTECIRKYGQQLGTLIAEGKVTLGMSREMCTLAWGEPFRNNRTIVAGTVHEQWVYGWHNYLYFENGKLVAIQD